MVNNGKGALFVGAHVTCGWGDLTSAGEVVADFGNGTVEVRWTDRPETTCAYDVDLRLHRTRTEALAEVQHEAVRGYDARRVREVSRG